MPSAVQEQEDRLVLLGAVDADHGRRPAGGGLPVDGPRVVALAVLAQAVELPALPGALGDAPAIAGPDARESQGLAGEGAEIRPALDRGGQRNAELALHESEGPGEPDVNLAEVQGPPGPAA